VPTNLKRDELLRHAQEVCNHLPGARVFFKYTCDRCGERVTFTEPNYLFEEGECHACGHRQPVTEGGYALDMTLSGPPHLT
jgi:DNA-directed RNA polymerase subunit RPC12/RpoP